MWVVSPWYGNVSDSLLVSLVLFHDLFSTFDSSQHLPLHPRKPPKTYRYWHFGDPGDEEKRMGEQTISLLAKLGLATHLALTYFRLGAGTDNDTTN